MTEANMKRLYEYFITTGQTARAEQITDIPRYAKFNSGEKEVVKEEPKKKVK